MKILKVVVLMLVLSLFLVSCSSDKDKDKDNSSSQSSSGIMSDLESNTDDVMSDLESNTDDIMSDIEDEKDKIEDNIESGVDKLDDNTEGNIPEDDSVTANTSVNTNFEDLENTSKGWGQGYDVDDLNRPISSVSYQEQYSSYDAFFIKENQNNIYLTFDEGYENGYTSQILDVLKEKNCTAAFFVTMDYVVKNPDLITRMIDEGHVVGNHSTTHPSMPSLSTQEMIDEIQKLHDYVLNNFNYTMTAFRPPRGEWSTKTLAVTQSLGYKTYFWSFAYKDWETDSQPDVEEALTRTTTAVHNGAIYLLHAVSQTNTTILSDFIDTVREDGYVFASLS